MKEITQAHEIKKPKIETKIYSLFTYLPDLLDADATNSNSNNYHHKKNNTNQHSHVMCNIQICATIRFDSYSFILLDSDHSFVVFAISLAFLRNVVIFVIWHDRNRTMSWSLHTFYRCTHLVQSVAVVVVFLISSATFTRISFTFPFSWCFVVVVAVAAAVVCHVLFPLHFCSM